MPEGSTVPMVLIHGAWLARTAGTTSPRTSAGAATRSIAPEWPRKQEGVEAA